MDFHAFFPGFSEVFSASLGHRWGIVGASLGSFWISTPFSPASRKFSKRRWGIVGASFGFFSISTLFSHASRRFSARRWGIVAFLLGFSIFPRASRKFSNRRGGIVGAGASLGCFGLPHLFPGLPGGFPNIVVEHVGWGFSGFSSLFPQLPARLLSVIEASLRHRWGIVFFVFLIAAPFLLASRRFSERRWGIVVGFWEFHAFFPGFSEAF